MKTLIVQGGRAGDLIQILPCIRHISEQDGNPVMVVVTSEFAPILEGCSYVEPIIFEGSFTDTVGAIELGKKHCDRILIGRVTERGENQCESFCQDAWRQLGCLELWNDLPLVFDRRNRVREQMLLEQFTRGLFSLYNVAGKSSPVPKGEAWIQRNKDRICPNVHWIDLSRILADRIYDLLGLMEHAEVLVTGDTATLHLAAASKVPCVNLIQHLPTRWHGSRPRNNSIAEWRYNEMPDLVPLNLLDRIRNP